MTTDDTSAARDDEDLGGEDSVDSGTDPSELEAMDGSVELDAEPDESWLAADLEELDLAVDDDSQLSDEDDDPDEDESEMALLQELGIDLDDRGAPGPGRTKGAQDRDGTVEGEVAA